jgi:hypothetical protein
MQKIQTDAMSLGREENFTSDLDTKFQARTEHRRPKLPPLSVPDKGFRYCKLLQVAAL